MVIKSSSSRQIDTLMADLMSERQVVREGAIARLTVIGGRAVERLTAFLDTREAAPRNRVAALRTLEAIADQRASRRRFARSTIPMPASRRPRCAWPASFSAVRGAPPWSTG